MSWFSKLERISGKLIEGVFKTKFAGPLQPVEIARALVREMADHKKVSVSHVYVPNSFEVLVSRRDWEQIEPVQETLVEEIKQFLLAKAKEKNFSFIQNPEIVFSAEDTVQSGEYQLSSKFTHTEDVPQVESEHTQVFNLGEVLNRVVAVEHLSKSELVVLAGSSSGMKFRLGKGVSTLGRRENNDIFLDDPNISRVHARLERSAEGYLLIDMGSLNGTYVNGQRIKQVLLKPGDIIKVGSTELDFRVV